MFPYDAWNRLACVAKGYRDSGGLHSGQAFGTLSYDGQNRRIVKAISGTGSGQEGTYHRYYEQHSDIEIRNGSDLLLKQQVWGLKYPVRRQSEPGHESTGS